MIKYTHTVNRNDKRKAFMQIEIENVNWNVKNELIHFAILFSDGNYNSNDKNSLIKFLF